jgi:hypothetical protein
MREMNLDMERAAKDSGAIFLSAPLSVSWTSSDFVDQGHFSAAGSERFAASLVGTLGAYCH